jgi:hypothetical protein
MVIDRTRLNIDIEYYIYGYVGCMYGYSQVARDSNLDCAMVMISVIRSVKTT